MTTQPMQILGIDRRSLNAALGNMQGAGVPRINDSATRENGNQLLALLNSTRQLLAENRGPRPAARAKAARTPRAPGNRQSAARTEPPALPTSSDGLTPDDQAFYNTIFPTS